MDQVIVKTFKHFYKHLLVENIVTTLTLLTEKNKGKINLLQATRMCNKVWEQVTTKTLKNCLKKADGY